MDFDIGSQRITVNIADRPALEQAVRGRWRAGEGFALATLNLDHLDKLKRDAAFRAAYTAQDFVVADGNPIVWLSRIAHKPVTLMPGSDLVLPLARWAADEGVKLALVGTTELALARAATVIEAEVPGVVVTDRISPPMGFDPSGDSGQAVLDQLAGSEARLCLLALGAPRQEVFAARARAALPLMGFASIGAGLDFLAGTQARAPEWVRAIAMEWLWRALTSPARLGPRYARSLVALPAMSCARSGPDRCRVLRRKKLGLG